MGPHNHLFSCVVSGNHLKQQVIRSSKLIISAHASHNICPALRVTVGCLKSSRCIHMCASLINAPNICIDMSTAVWIIVITNMTMSSVHSMH